MFGQKLVRREIDNINGLLNSSLRRGEDCKHPFQRHEAMYRLTRLFAKQGSDFLQELLQYDPQLRMTCAQALKHRWLAADHTVPVRRRSSHSPSTPSQHVFPFSPSTNLARDGPAGRAEPALFPSPVQPGDTAKPKRPRSPGSHTSSKSTSGRSPKKRARGEQNAGSNSPHDHLGGNERAIPLKIWSRGVPSDEVPGLD